MNVLKKNYRIILGFPLLFLFFHSCSTEDVQDVPDSLPVLKISSDKSSLSENEGTITVSAELDKAISEDVSIPVTFSGTSKVDDDFTVSSNKIVISSGSKSGSIVITGKQDVLVEGTETLIIKLVPPALKFSNSQDLSVEVSILDDDADSDNDGVLDADDNCPNEAGEATNNGCPFLGFLINEVLYDPPSDNSSTSVVEGDANGDGSRSALADEFIEFFNSGEALDISGYTISDATGVRHTFPQGTTVPKNGVIVVFGGGTPTTGSFGGAIVQTASSGELNLTNSGDKITVKDTSGTVVVELDIEPLSNNPDESYTRNPDLTGDFEQHTSIDEANNKLYSPGTKLNGTSF